MIKIRNNIAISSATGILTKKAENNKMDYFDGCLVMAIAADLSTLIMKLISLDTIVKVPIESLFSIIDFAYFLMIMFSFPYWFGEETVSGLRKPKSYKVCVFLLLACLIIRQYIQDYSTTVALISSAAFYFLINEIIRHFLYWVEDIRNAKN